MGAYPPVLWMISDTAHRRCQTAVDFASHRFLRCTKFKPRHCLLDASCVHYKRLRRPIKLMRPTDLTPTDPLTGKGATGPKETEKEI